jgi:hypothetical protein
MKTDTRFSSYLAQFFLEWDMFQTRIVEQIKTNILCSVIFLFFKNRAVYEIKWNQEKKKS